MRNGRILTTLVTHDRLDYTKRCLESYLDTTPKDQRYIVVVDNASTDGTQDYLQKMLKSGVDAVILNSENRYPGAAVNQGWTLGLQEFDAPLLHRSDNDVEYQPGWYEYVEKMFTCDFLGQLGLLTFDENGGNGMELNINVHPLDPELLINFHYGGNIGGVCVVSRTNWDNGVRYRAQEWQPGANEDWWFSQDIRAQGFQLWAVVDPIVKNLSKDQGEKYPEYTKEKMDVRQIHWHWHKDENGNWIW